MVIAPTSWPPIIHEVRLFVSRTASHPCRTRLGGRYCAGKWFPTCRCGTTWQCRHCSGTCGSEWGVAPEGDPQGCRAAGIAESPTRPSNLWKNVSYNYIHMPQRVSGHFILYYFNLRNFNRCHFNRSQFQPIAFSTVCNFDLNYFWLMDHY